MRPKRPTAVTVMGILSIVFGSLGMLMFTCIGLFVLFLHALFSRNPLGINILTLRWEFMNAQVPGYAAVEIGGYVLGLVLTVLLLIGGIGLLNLQNWARLLCLGYGVATLLAEFGTLLFFLVFVNPAMGRLMEEWRRQQAQQGQAGGGGPGSFLESPLMILYAGLQVVFAVLLLVILLLPNVSAAFTGRRPLRDAFHDPYEDDYAPPRRPRGGWDA